MSANGRTRKRSARNKAFPLIDKFLLFKTDRLVRWANRSDSFKTRASFRERALGLRAKLINKHAFFGLRAGLANSGAFECAVLLLMPQHANRSMAEPTYSLTAACQRTSSTVCDHRSLSGRWKTGAQACEMAL